jgi:hypothetical protein
MTTLPLSEATLTGLSPGVLNHCWMPLKAGAPPQFSIPEPPYSAAVWQSCRDTLLPAAGAAAPFSRELPTAWV